MKKTASLGRHAEYGGCWIELNPVAGWEREPKAAQVSIIWEEGGRRTLGEGAGERFFPI